MSEQHQNQQVAEPELLGRWHHGQGFLCSGSLRIARADFDTNPTDEFQGKVFEDICNTMNDRLAAYRSGSVQSPCPSLSEMAAMEGLTRWVRPPAPGVKEDALGEPPAQTHQQEPVAITLMTDDQALTWAWEKVKSDFSDEKWTAIEHQKFHALFLSGWNYRAQLQRQRPAQPDRSGCTAGKDEECTRRQCGTKCPALPVQPTDPELISSEQQLAELPGSAMRNVAQEPNVATDSPKYELVKTDTKQFGLNTLYRIRALVSIGLDVSPGDLGGYVKSEKNLSQTGNAWVYDDACLNGDAYVKGNAQVSGNAWIYGNAQVSGNARVYGEARVYGSALVTGNAQVYGDAYVSGDAVVTGEARVSNSKTWLLVGPAKSSGYFTTAFVDEKLGVRVVRGCFSGSLLEFSQKIETTHADKKEFLEQYRLFCKLIAFNFRENNGASVARAIEADAHKQEGWKLGQPITEEMHQAACKTLMRANGLDGTPQRMLDSMLNAALEAKPSEYEKSAGPANGEQGQVSCCCPNCESMSKELATLKAARGEEPLEVYLFHHVQSGEFVFSLDENCNSTEDGYWSRATFKLK